MRGEHEPLRRGLVLFGVAACGVLGGCKGDPPPPAGVVPIKEAPRGGTPTPDPAVAWVPPGPTEHVLGHVRLGDPFALVAKVSGQLAPPGQDGAITIDALRKAARAGAGSRVGEAIALHLDPGRAVGCAILDPTEHAIPLACVFGFQRGLPQLLEDLGPVGRQPAGGPDAALYEVDGLSLHLHALGPDVVVAFDASSFADSRDYLQSLTARGAEWDVELTLHVQAAVERRRAVLEEISSDVVQRAATLADDPMMLALVQASVPGLAALAPAVAEDGTAVLSELLDLGAQLDVLQVGARLEDGGLRVGVHAKAKAGSELAQELAARPALPTGLLDWAPRHTWLVWLDEASSRSLSPKVDAFLERVLAGLVAESFGLPPDRVESALAAFARENERLYEDTRLLALFNGPDTWGGAAWVRPLHTGVSGREAWQSWTASLRPADLLGAEAARELGKIVRWSSSPEAFAIDGLPVDRFVVEPAPRFEKKLAASLGDDDELAREVVAWISAKPALVAVDRLEAAGAAAVVLAPGGTEAFARKVAAAHEGQGRAPRGQIDHLLVGEGRPRFVLALSVADIVEFVHGVLPPDLLGGLPREAGRELGDIAVVGRITGDATWEMDLQVGQPTLDLVRALW